MSLSALISNVSVNVAAIQRPDKIDQHTTCTLVIRDDAGTALYQKGNPVSITDSILGNIFTGYVTGQPSMQNLYPNTTNLWTLPCIQSGDYLAAKPTSNWLYNNQQAGAIAVDQVQRYGAREGLSARAALRWDEEFIRWREGTLTNTVATTNATNGNVGGGCLELAPAGSQVNYTDGTSVSGPTPAIKFIGAAVSGFTNAYDYREIYNSGSIVIAPGDSLSYDVFISSTSPQIMAGVDFVCTDGTTFRDSTGAGTDAQGIGPHPKNDLAGLANDRWYSRGFGVAAPLIGKTISYFSVAFEGDNPGTYTAYFRHITWNSPSNGNVDIFNNAQNTIQQQGYLQNNGYVNHTVTAINAYDTILQQVTTHDISAANIAKSSFITWKAITPGTSSVLLETSVDNGSSWQAATSGGAVPNLLAGMSLSSRSISYRISMILGTDPTLPPQFTSVNLVVNPSYAATKSDTITSYTTATDFATGTLTNTRTVGSSSTPAITLNGYTRNWDDANYNNQTFFGSGNQFITNKQFILQCFNANDARSRLEFPGAVSQFTAEVDVVIPPINANIGMTYATTNWGNSNDSYAYAISVSTTQLLFAKGNNSTGAGSFTSLQTATIAVSAGSVHRLKMVIDLSAHTHKFYLDGILYINTSDSSYTTAGDIALRLFNNTGATIQEPFDNFGVVSSLSGTWQSSSIDISGATTYGSSMFEWDATSVPNGTTITAQASTDGGSTFQNVTNGGIISGLTAGQSLAGKSLIIKMTLTASNASVIPVLNGVTAWIMGQYSASGTRIAPSLALLKAGRADTALVNWNALLPTGTSLAVATSINAGSSYQAVASPGGAISGISTQPDPIEDLFTSIAYRPRAFGGPIPYNYQQSNFGGTNAAVTWDTTNSRVLLSGGNYGTLLYRSTLFSADNYVMADFDESDGSGIITNYNTATTSGYFVQIWDDSASGTQNTVKLFRRAASVNTQIGGTASITFKRGSIKRFKLDVQAGVIVVSMDGVTLISYTDGSPLSAGQSGFVVNSLLRAYSIRIQQYGQDVTTLGLLTQLTLNSTNPLFTPQVLDLEAFVSSTDIGPGVVVPSQNFQRTFLNANIDSLNKQSNYWWYFSSLNLIFQKRNATPAPFVLACVNSQTIGGQTVGDVLLDGAMLSNGADSYRNHQIMRGAIATSIFTEIKAGDGQTRTWNVTRPLSVPPTSIILNGQTQTMGMKGIDVGKNFYYQLNSTAIDQDASGVLLQTLDSFVIVYSGSFPQDVPLDNTGGFPGTITQSMMAAIENAAGGSSSGIVEAVLDVSSTPTTVAQATTQGNQLLQRFGTIGRTFTCKTLRSGFTPGMQVSLFVPQYNLNNVQMLITQVDVVLSIALGVTGGLLYMWKLTLTESVNLQSWVKLFVGAFS